MPEHNLVLGNPWQLESQHAWGRFAMRDGVKM